MPDTNNETELRRRIISLQQRVAKLEKALGEQKRSGTTEQSAIDPLNRQEAELRATLYGIGDAIITADIAGRVTRLNPAAEQLTGWTEAEAVGRPLDEVFQIISEESRRPVESPVERVRREGTVVGLANHTLLISKETDSASGTATRMKIYDPHPNPRLRAESARKRGLGEGVFSKEGREIPIAYNAAPIFDPQGTITGVVLVFRDQTEERLNRRLIEIRLSLIEYAAHHTLDELLTEALDLVGTFVDSPIGFYHFVEADQKTLSLQQWSSRTLKEFCQAEGKGMSYSIEQAGVWAECVSLKKPVIHNDYASLPYKKGLPAGHTAVIRELVAPVMRQDQVVAILGVGNKPTEYTRRDMEIVSYLADVTWEVVRQKRAEEALRQERDKAQKYLDIAGVMFVALNAKGQVTLINRKGAELLGYNQEKIIGQNWFDSFLPANLKEKVKITFEQLMAGKIEQVEYYENPLVTKESEVRTIAWHNTILKDEAGNISGTLSSGEDITERKQAEEERARLNANLAAKNVELEQVVYVASHDLRSPLVNIDGYSRELGYALAELQHVLTGAPAEMLAAAAPLLDQDIPEALRFIRTSAAKMDTLLMGLLRLSRSGRATLTIKPVDMNELLANVISSSEFQIKAAGVELEVAALPPCHSDAVQVNQVFSNLLSNALKYLDPRRAGVIHITGRIAGERSVYCVEDNGIGIAPAHLDKIFEIFHRLDPSRGEGEGLGLTIVKRILGRLDGAVWVESAIGSGSRFYVALPAGRR